MVGSFNQIARFGVVGVAATVVHLSISWALMSATSFPLLLTNGCGFLVGFLTSFCGHYFFTFPGSRCVRTSLVRFLVVALAGLLGSSLLVHLLKTNGQISDYLTALLSVLVIPFISFLASRFWAFKK